VRVTDRYAAGVRFLMKRGALALLLFGAMLAAIVGLAAPCRSLAPAEDQGYVMVIPILQDAASLKRTEAVNARLTRRCSSTRRWPR